MLNYNLNTQLIPSSEPNPPEIFVLTLKITVLFLLNPHPAPMFKSVNVCRNPVVWLLCFAADTLRHCHPIFRVTSALTANPIEGESKK